GIA
ncbi:subtilase family protein, partial [Vibrio parahaemolyticus V-223/04]